MRAAQTVQADPQRAAPQAGVVGFGQLDGLAQPGQQQGQVLAGHPGPYLACGLGAGQ